jgi:hypothetical protein
VRRLLLAALVIAGAALPTSAAAAPVDTFQIQTFIPGRIWSQTAWIPQAVEPQLGRVRRLPAGGRTFRGVWAPVAIGSLSTRSALGILWRGRRFRPPTTAVIADTRLTAKQRRRFTPVAELFRDADVLVVAAGHPACAGITRAQAQAIVRGRVTRWSAVVAGAPDDRIRVRHPLDTAGEPESRFGVVHPGGFGKRMPYAPDAKGVRDGGVSAAAAGDTSIAAITSWSRLRRVVPGTCVVPLDGVAPSDATVGDLSYPEAFPVTYLRPRFAIDARDRALYAAMAALFRSERFAGLLAQTGGIVRQSA